MIDEIFDEILNNSDEFPFVRHPYHTKNLEICLKLVPKGQNILSSSVMLRMIR